MKVPTVKLSEVAQLNPALAVLPSDTEVVSFLPMSAVDAQSTSTVDREFRSYSDVKKGYTSFQNGDVLVAKITPCFENGKIAQAKLDHRFGFGSTEFHVIRPHPDRADARYLVHFLRQDRVRRLGESRMTGSAGQRRVPEHFLSGLNVPMPALADQRRIAEILDKADALRAKRRASLAQLDTLTQSIFLDMFGDPATNPRRWQVASVGSVADVQGGLQVTAARQKYPRAIPYLRVANVYRGRLDLSEVKMIQATDAEIARTTLLKNDFLVVEGHGNPEEIGRGALWDESIPECVHQNHLIRVRFNDALIAPRFGSEFLNSAAGRRYLLRAGNTTSGLNTISVADVRATPILVPPVGLQHEFVHRAQEVENIRKTQTAALAQLATLFASIQQRAFRGELGS